MHLRRNVLIFHAGALGDFVLSWPLAMALARIHPQSRIIYVTHGQKGALAERVLRVESADIEGGWHHLFGGDAGTLPAGPRKMLEGAHSIYSFIAAEGDAWSGAVRAAAPGVDLCCLEPRPAEGVAIHSVDHLLSQLESRKAMHEAVVQMVRSITERGVMNRKPVAKRVVIHPGSGSAGKCWPAGHFVEVCRRFRDEGFDVRALMGEVEAERWSVDAVARFGEVAAVRQLATYVDLLNELLEAEAFLGNDSGPGHLAGVIGVPAFTVFGPTDPVVWRPVGPNVLTLRQMPMDELEPARVFEWVTRQ